MVKETSQVPLKGSWGLPGPTDLILRTFMLERRGQCNRCDRISFPWPNFSGTAQTSESTLRSNIPIHLQISDNDSATPEPDGEVGARTNGKGSPGEQFPSPVQFVNSVGAGDSSRSTLQRCAPQIHVPAFYFILTLIPISVIQSP